MKDLRAPQLGSQRKCTPSSVSTRLLFKPVQPDTQGCWLDQHNRHANLGHPPTSANNKDRTLHSVDPFTPCPAFLNERSMCFTEIHV